MKNVRAKPQESLEEGQVNPNVSLLVQRLKLDGSIPIIPVIEPPLNVEMKELPINKSVEENLANNLQVGEGASTTNVEEQQREEETVAKQGGDEEMKEGDANQQGDAEQKNENEESPKSPIKPQRTSNQIIAYRNCEVLRDFIVTPLQRVAILEEEIRHFKFIIPKVVARPVDFTPTHIVTKHEKEKAYERFAYQKLMSHRNVHQSLRHSNILFFPHKNLIQYDCGKLQRLATLLKNLHQKGHKVLIFTQMTRILDVLENFLNLHGYTYVRLDGSVKVEMRQRLVDKFNLNKKLFCFISSTRCGGIGINLTGADCVIFYDTDWNPAMDRQAQDRCHRIGQTKTVHIYRLISVNTIEENIFKKSLQKRDFGGLIIEGNFDMEIFMKRGITLKDILEDDTIFKPKRRNLLQEENIVFHTNSHNLSEDMMKDNRTMMEQQQQLESSGALIIDMEKQKELELYRKRFEEALVRIEDKEDVIALQQARREIDDEFDEEAAAQQQEAAAAQGTKDPSAITQAPSEAGATTVAAPEDLDEQEVASKAMAAELDSRSAGGLQRDMLAHKSEFINWREHPTLNNVTKLSINYFEHTYSFDAYLEDRSKKDNKFVNPLTEDSDEQQQQQPAEENDQSDFSMSGEDNNPLPDGEEEEEAEWQRGMAEQLYKSMREEVEQKYTLE